MGRPKRLYPLGRYRLHIRGEIDPAKQYLVQLEYTWNRQVIRKGMNIFVRLGDWNEKANKGRGGVRASYGPEANRINSLLLARADKIDGLLAEYQEKHPNQITAQVIADFLLSKWRKVRHIDTMFLHLYIRRFLQSRVFHHSHLQWLD